MLFVNIFYQEAAWILFSYGREFHATCPSNTRNLIYIHIVAFNETCNSEICKNGDWDRYCRCCIHVSLSSAHIGIWEGMAILPACLPALLLLLFSGTSCNTRKIRGPVSVELCTDYQFYVTLLNRNPLLCECLPSSGCLCGSQLLERNWNLHHTILWLETRLTSWHFYLTPKWRSN